jgi:hypothetical protein
VPDADAHPPERSSSLARSSGPTGSQPGISRPCITAAVALVVATSPADRPGSTWTRTPPWPLALIAMRPRMRKEGQAAEDLLLGQLRVRTDQVPDPGGKILVISHTAIVPSE